MTDNLKIKLSDIAGFCPEEAIWKLIVDVSDFLIKEKCGYHLSADTIMVDGDTFLIESNKDDENASEMVWTLGAIVYYVATGHIIFGGHGQSYQQDHPHVPLPALPKVYHSLTPVVHQCLCSDADKRVSLEELHGIACKELDACRKQQRSRETTNIKTNKKDNKHVEKWPEEMKEI